MFEMANKIHFFFQFQTDSIQTAVKHEPVLDYDSASIQSTPDFPLLEGADKFAALIKRRFFNSLCLFQIFSNLRMMK